MMKKRRRRVDVYRRLEGVMARLRAPGGCPWDRRQTHQSLKPYLLEEAHEALEAIDRRDRKALLEELGDVLLQVVFHARIAEEEGAFNLRDVARVLCEKMERRHPHVFGDVGKSTVRQVHERWEQIKKREKPERRSPLEGLPKSLPSLHRAQRMHEKLAKGSSRASLSALQQEAERSWRTYRASRKSGRSRSEKALGDFLFTLTALTQAEGLHAEMALRKTASRFEAQQRKATSVRNEK